MILETLLSLSLHYNPANIPSAILTPPAQARVIGGFSSSSSRSSFSSSSRSSFSSRPSSSFSSRPSSSFSSTPRIASPPPVIRSTPTPKVSTSTPVYKAPSINTSTSAGVVRINKQVETPKVSSTQPKSSVASGSASVSTPVYTPSPEVITRDRYIERYSDGGIGSNPWFWMYMMDQNRPVQSTSSQPTQVIVKSSDGEEVKVPEHQLIVKKNSHNPVREFFVFALGGGIGVLIGRKLTLN